MKNIHDEYIQPAITIAIFTISLVVMLAAIHGV